MKQYISGYYCRNDFDLEILRNDNNRKIIEALREAYPLGLTVRELFNRTKIPEKTIYPQIKSLSREHFIVKLGKQTKLRGRPSSKKSTDIIAQRVKGEFTIEDVNRFFDTYERKKVKKFPLPPGNVEYSDLFTSLLFEVDAYDELEGVSRFLFEFIKKIVRRIIESDNRRVTRFSPTNKLEYCCSQCGINHEIRDLIRALCLTIVDNLETGKPYIELLKENNFITDEAYSHAVSEIEQKEKRDKWLEDEMRATHEAIEELKKLEESLKQYEGTTVK